MSEADPAPKEVLQEVSCGCQGPCKSKRCNCRKAGLKKKKEMDWLQNTMTAKLRRLLMHVRRKVDKLP
ncbi:unnamed protein product [Acanthoscelides obtectus]|uniref:Uncharacterized protein n=1 Tax=Acanthoscelides obtectus TaxID=200917 RepID=A0A9P0KJM1_ACAOB|nr:unnamed protein product [Acanthoscelides obtectus]CAK1641753.1 hypothetical protein AOBTE_LOCUS12609 [Acanthoscelides obtectus]